MPDQWPLEDTLAQDRQIAPAALLATSARRVAMTVPISMWRAPQSMSMIYARRMIR